MKVAIVALTLEDALVRHPKLRVYIMHAGWPMLDEFHFCPACGCVAYWLAIKSDQQGRRRIAVNLRLAESEAVAGIPIDRFDGLDTFEDLPRDGRCVGDYWF